MKPRRSITQLTGISFAIVAIWVMFALFSASEFYRRTHAMGSVIEWSAVICCQLASGMLWAVFTPPVVAIAERLPLRDRRWLRNLLALAAIVPVLSLVRAAGGGALQRIIEQKAVTREFIELSIAVRFHRNIFLLVVIIGITNILLAYRRSVMRERDAFWLQEQVTKASLAQLNAGMLPRVMFDTMQAISDRVKHDPEGADQMIVGLSDLLRATLALDRSNDVTLAEELEHIDRYLDLEKARADGRLNTRIDFEEQLLGARVPPLVVHALVEDALAGAVPPGERSLQIAGSDAGGRLHIEIRRESEVEPETPLDQTRERLEHLLSEQFSLDRRREGTAEIVTVELPLRFAEAAS
jgi:two-component system LytT family sensor kinase